MRYGLICYGFSSKTNLKPIDTLQKNIVKCSFHSNSKYLKQIMSLENLHKYILILKYFFNEQYRLKTQIPYSIRQQSFYVPRINSNYGKKLPCYYVPTFLNCMKNSIHSIHNYSDLKSMLLICIDNIHIRK